MKKYIIKTLGAIALCFSLTGCGDSFLDTKIYDAVDLDKGLAGPTSIGYALNGAYYQLYRYNFAGNYATLIGDIGSDLSYHYNSTNHFTDIYRFGYQATDTYLYYIWNYGYKVIDNAARIIEACENLIPTVSGDDEIYLKVYEAEARCLRAYASLRLVNVFCHQVMVDGKDFSNYPGLVVVDKPIVAFENVKRSSVGATYGQITNDLEKAISLFESVGTDQGDPNYFTLAAAYGLLARANMYLENWDEAIEAAASAIAESGITELVYTDSEYAALYRNSFSNDESLFYLYLDAQTSYGSSGPGTMFSAYGYCPSPKLMNLYGEKDCRRSILYFTNNSTNEIDPDSWWSAQGTFSGGKFYYGGGNVQLATNYLINAPEMFLIQAEGYANNGDLSSAQEALLVVAKRNNAITSTADLPQDKEGLLSFIMDERARELFQEGHRLWDLRRWNLTVGVEATNAPDVMYLYNDYQIADMVFPIPDDEVNAGFGVEQNQGWASLRPTN